MNYKVTHITTYGYSSPVSVCHNQVMLVPRDGDRVHCPWHRLTVRPTTTVSDRRQDSFGNYVNSFSIEENHRQLQITATSRVSIQPSGVTAASSSPGWESVAAGIAGRSDPEWLSCCPFVFDSPRVRARAPFEMYGARAFVPGLPILQAALALTRQIHTDFKYDTKATTVDTTTEAAFELRKGVCQDFAHVMVATLRSLGIPARYVSGYLRTEPPAGKPRLVGADQSHAWVSAYCGPDLQWVDLDPTNDCLCSTDHIPIAFGRDYSDVVPIRGVFLGGGNHTITVSVDVSPLDE